MSTKSLSFITFSAFLVFFPVVSSSDPVLSGHPFVTVWNAPTSRCLEMFGVDLDLTVFDIVLNKNHSFVGTDVVIFYNNQLGVYPYYNDDGDPVNGGLPQNNSLRDHLHKAYVDMKNAISDPSFKGVAVIDWENWRPIWIRNWDKKKLYQQGSIDLVRQMFPDLPQVEAIMLAKREFEMAAKKFMRSTLKLGRKVRPNGLWGYYGFPCCYNYGYKNSSLNYTGECPKEEILRNNNLTWMWEASQALYPDIYLEKELKMSANVGRYVKHRVQEAFRVAKLASNKVLPILPYARLVYTYSMDFLTQEDLVQTIGQSAALGAAGIILWGNADYTRSKESCLAVKSYIDDTLGKYVVNVSSAALLCSKALCTGNGRCVRKDPSSEAYLHLHQDSFSIKRDPVDKGFVLSGQATKWDITYLGEQFLCHCYPGWKGTDCRQSTVM
ncbi:hyaluronidase-1-like [Rhinophrynus dorsalis]